MREGRKSPYRMDGRRVAGDRGEGGMEVCSRTVQTPRRTVAGKTQSRPVIVSRVTGVIPDGDVPLVRCQIPVLLSARFGPHISPGPNQGDSLHRRSCGTPLPARSREEQRRHERIICGMSHEPPPLITGRNMTVRVGIPPLLPLSILLILNISPFLRRGSGKHEGNPAGRQRDRQRRGANGMEEAQEARRGVPVTQ